MQSVFTGLEVRKDLRPSPKAFDFDLDRALSSIVALEARVPESAFTAGPLGVERIGNGIVIGEDGLVLTIGYLVTEAQEVVLTTNEGRQVPAHVLGFDQATGFGLVHALEPLGVPALPIGDSRRLRPNAPLIVAGAGGRAHAVAARLTARQPFIGYWEYFLDEALFTGPAHPHWSGAAVIDGTGALVGVGSLQLEQGSSEEPSEPLNMSVPVELLAPILDDLARGRSEANPRPWLGLYSQEVDDRIVVLNVSQGGPAARAELRRGDLILRLDGEDVEGLGDFYTRLWSLGPAGVPVRLTLSRGGDVFEVEVRSIDRRSVLWKPRFN